ncbi:MAG: nucleotidyltransferase domain-containing protein [Candidatus Saganbacteria bacterium]|nr:nucleotidyltransferase domain-containing protein [Candidatus Saganbacteria bacterium]
MNNNIKVLLKDLKKGLHKKYRQRLKELLVFGSYARGEEQPGSDLDVALVVDDFASIGREIAKTGDLVSKLSLENNVVISLHPIRLKDWTQRKTPLILNLKKEAITL